MPRARFVGNYAAGQELEFNGMQHAVATQRPINWEPGESYLGASINDPVMEVYDIHQMAFDSGHRHYYAALEGVPLVGLMNEMWHGYQVSESLRHQVIELRSQNERLKQELYRERFKNQFKRYPSEDF